MLNTLLKKGWLILILAMMIMPIAFSLTIYPDNHHSTLFKGIEKNFSISIEYNWTNTPHNFTIYNVTFNPMPYFKFETIKNMSVNQTKDLKFSIRTNSTFDTKFIGTLTYYYLVDDMVEPSNHSVLVSGFGLTPFNIKVYKGDTIQFKNIDVINHTLTDLQTSSKIIIGINKTHNFLVNEQRTYNFVDEQSSTGFSVNVSNNIIPMPTKNPILNTNYDFYVTSMYESSALNVEFIKPSAEIDYNEFSTGVIILRPVDTLYNIKFESDNWLNFTRNNINVSSEQVIFFNVTPRGITTKEQTGMTYNKTITIKGSNIEDKVLTFSIKINEHNFTNEDSDGIQYVLKPLTPEQTIKYCKDLYGDIDEWEGDCAKIIVNQTQIEYKERILDANLDESDVINFFNSEDRAKSDIDTLKTIVQDYDKANRERLNEIMNSFGNLSSQVNENTATTSEIKDIVKKFKVNENTKSWGWIILVSVVSILGLLYLYQSAKLKYKKKVRGL